ncbi:ABC transporter ATP-binding protein [Paenibacillus segetis]|uniref:ABC transporter ATP-binding protein n=1 Tax=Paenibacillus segetis TaxID=1325360 RepID=A0ABQ1YS01_9BACL|nr:ABC transporter ATP-binding protein [Paenibacillus segetis]GGH36607.1 ABC transporter ATP-binding protein [Paenibacillus segetis]
MASIQLKQVTKKYNDSKIAVDAIDLDIHEGSFTVLLGPSGCGKTTTLRMIAGLEDISSGQLWIGEQDVTQADASERGIAMVFQNYALYPHMTVRNNIEFGLKNAKKPPTERTSILAKVMKMVGLEEYMDAKPGSLSGGQRQRVALGRAVSKSPKVFLMDEPLSNLDAKLRNQMRTEIIRLHKQLKSTFVYVTHDQTEAMTMGDTIVVMNQGRIMQVGSPREIYHDPNHLFVAQFIGDPGMNILPMHGGSIVAFRAQKALVSTQQFNGISLTGKVVTQEMLGADMLYCVETALGSAMVKQPDVGPILEGNISIFIPQEDLYFFDTEGHRIREQDEVISHFRRLQSEGRPNEIM